MATVHQVRVQDRTLKPPLTVLCPGYELSKWRASELVADLFDRHLASFSLSFTDWQAISGETAATSLRKAAKAVYATDKYRRRGEFGELILHAAVVDFFNAQPAVSKIAYKDSANDTVKGFDCVHLVTTADDGVELWLGEVKFYSDLNAAIRDVTNELAAHLSQGFLRAEFSAITNKLDSSWPHSQTVREMLDEATSLDDIVDRLVIPVLLTYNSDAISAATAHDDAYERALTGEAEAAWAAFAQKFASPFPTALQLILVPLEDKDRLVNLFQQKLQVWQHI